MTKNIIKTKQWSYRLYTEDDKPYLQVVLGSVAIYEKVIPLSDTEFSLCQSDEQYLENLVNQTRENES